MKKIVPYLAAGLVWFSATSHASSFTISIDEPVTTTVFELPLPSLTPPLPPQSPLGPVLEPPPPPPLPGPVLEPPAPPAETTSQPTSQPIELHCTLVPNTYPVKGTLEQPYHVYSGFVITWQNQLCDDYRISLSFIDPDGMNTTGVRGKWVKPESDSAGNHSTIINMEGVTENPVIVVIKERVNGITHKQFAGFYLKR